MLGCSSSNLSNEKTKHEEARYQVRSKLTTSLLEKLLVDENVVIHFKKKIWGFFFGSGNWTRMLLARRNRKPWLNCLKWWQNITSHDWNSKGRWFWGRLSPQLIYIFRHRGSFHVFSLGPQIVSLDNPQHGYNACLDSNNVIQIQCLTEEHHIVLCLFLRSRAPLPETPDWSFHNWLDPGHRLVLKPLTSKGTGNTHDWLRPTGIHSWAGDGINRYLYQSGFNQSCRTTRKLFIKICN